MSDLNLNDGRTMPALGLGTYKLGDPEAAALVEAAVEAGYRSVDTAMIYANETGVGAGLAAAGKPVWVQTKVWNSDQGIGQTRAALETSLRRLGLDRIDLYLIHWPVPELGRYVETWQEMIRLREEGLIGSIGVCNFQPEHLDILEAETGVLPAVNQIELNPTFQQAEARVYHAAKGIVTQSWAPLGQGRLLEDPRLAAIAAKHQAQVAQVVIAWHLALGLSVIPKTASPDRARTNLAAENLRLDAADMKEIASFDRVDGRMGPDPATFALGAD